MVSVNGYCICVWTKTCGFENTRVRVFVQGLSQVASYSGPNHSHKQKHLLINIKNKKNKQTSSIHFTNEPFTNDYPEL